MTYGLTVITTAAATNEMMSRRLASRLVSFDNTRLLILVCCFYLVVFPFQMKGLARDAILGSCDGNRKLLKRGPLYQWLRVQVFPASTLSTPSIYCR
jgi:hypothetical protein